MFGCLDCWYVFGLFLGFVFNFVIMIWYLYVLYFVFKVLIIECFCFIIIYGFFIVFYGCRELFYLVRGWVCVLLIAGFCCCFVSGCFGDCFE